jgi:hypothetical protein
MKNGSAVNIKERFLGAVSVIAVSFQDGSQLFYGCHSTMF